MRFLTLAACLLMACVAVSASHIVKEQIETAPSGWVRLHRASPSQQLELLLMIAQQNTDKLLAKFESVSDPTNPDYGNFLTNAEVNAMTAPLDTDVAEVLQWLNNHGIRTEADTLSFTPNKDIITVTVSVAQAEALLHTQYYEFQHETKKTAVVRALSYKVPTYLAKAIDAVGPTVRFPSHSTVRHAKVTSKKHTVVPVRPSHHHGSHIVNEKRKAIKKPLTGCPLGTTPGCLKQLYNVNNYVANSNTSLAVTGYLEQYIAPSDLLAFFTAFDKNDTRNATIVGPNVPSSPGVEASLDIQYSMGVAPGVPATFWYTAGRQPNSTDNEPFLSFLLLLSSTDEAPWVVSTSYGDDEPTVNYNYATRVNTEFQKAGVRGISMIFSSGDGGVAGGQPQQCTNFIPTYPAGSPYITSVGATTSSGPEVAASFSSGGFTNYWTRPDYQAAAVKAYVTEYGQNIPPQNLWNATGRGFPDVSAQGTSFLVYVSGFPMPVDGTSCSSPTFAGIVSLLNDVRFVAGKSSLGFLNPLFYQNPSMFNDVTSGSNPGCGTNGFQAAQGWDPVTGLGTPNFTAMSTVVQNLP